MRPKVYISGPMSCGDKQININTASEACCDLIDAGFAPLCPQLTLYLQEEYDYNTSHDVWMAVDAPWVLASDAVYRLPGKSDGADYETRLATKNGIPVFASIDELREYFFIAENNSCPCCGRNYDDGNVLQACC